MSDLAPQSKRRLDDLTDICEKLKIDIEPEVDSKSASEETLELIANKIITKVKRIIEGWNTWNISSIKIGLFDFTVSSRGEISCWYGTRSLPWMIEYLADNGVSKTMKRVENVISGGILKSTDTILKREYFEGWNRE